MSKVLSQEQSTTLTYHLRYGEVREVLSLEQSTALTYRLRCGEVGEALPKEEHVQEEG